MNGSRWFCLLAVVSLFPYLETTIPSSLISALIILAYGAFIIVTVREVETVHLPITLATAAGLSFIWIGLIIYSGRYAESSLLFFPIYMSVIVSTNFFLIPAVINRSDFYHSLALIGVIVSVLAIPLWLFSPLDFGLVVFENWTSVPRDFTSIFDNPSVLGKVALFGLFGALGAREYGENRLYSVYAAVCVVGLALSFSRGAILAAAVAMLFILFQRVASQEFVVLTTVLGVGGILVVSTVYLLDIQFPFLYGVSLSGRLVVWEAIRELLDPVKSLVGVGFYSEPSVIEPYADPDLYRGEGAHSTYYSLLFRGGVVLLTLHLMMYWSPVVNELRQDSVNTPFIGAVVGIAVLMFFDSILLFQLRYVGFVLTISLGLLAVPESTDEIR